METNIETKKRNSRRTLQGVVVGDGMTKTIAVQVERLFKHEKYKKYIRRHSKYLVHDEKGEAPLGSRVEIGECRPLSKTKRWRLIRVMGAAVETGPVAGEAVVEEVLTDGVSADNTETEGGAS
jgi:small subunit ribosomal protein S17